MSPNIYAQRAHELIKHGYTPIPLTGKKALLDGWPKLRNVTDEQIDEWERAGLWKNIGLLLGEASGNLVVLDFDGMAGYVEFSKHFPGLMDTYTVLTGSGKGMHKYYKVDLLPDNLSAKGAVINGETVNLEIRSDGLSIVAPPSIHPDTGKAYEVELRLPVMRLADIAKVTEWVKCYRPPQKEWTPPSLGASSNGDLNPQLLKAVEAVFLSKPHKIHGNWINCACPNTAAHKHGDAEFSFGYNPANGAGNCFVCEGMNLKEICSYIGIDPANFGGIYEKSETLNVRIATNGTAHAPMQTAQPEALPIVKRSDRLSTFTSRLYDYDTPRDIAPVPFPIKALHSLGGMARISKAGKILGIVGVSGGGKTSCLETMVDSWLDDDVPSLVWSPEWDADEFIERAVQRYGGASAEDMYLHDLYIYEKQHNLPHRSGKELTPEQLDASTKALRKLQGWKTQVGYLDMPFLTVQNLRESMAATMVTLDFKPRVLIIDYVQLMLALDPTRDMTMYNLLMQIKAVCKANGLVGVIATQVTKTSSKGQADGKLLDSMDARYVNDDAFNLFVTINPDRNADKEFLPSAVLNVSKNSLGIKGKVRVGVAWDRLAFETVKHHNQDMTNQSNLKDGDE